MRTPFVAGNWKMHLTSKEAGALVRALREGLTGATGVELAVAPPATALAAALEAARGSPIAVLAQNCHWEKQGAFTGEIAAEQIAELGCAGVIVGHSERRAIFGDTDEGVGRKLQAALRAGLRPIVCLGETLEQREAGQTMAVVTRQFEGALAGLKAEQLAPVTLAYEPVWAIGTGRTATPVQAQEVHAHLRGLLRTRFGEGVAGAMRIQYGGSVKPDNMAELMAQPDIDGALVGGASLKADSFLAIVRYRQ